MLLGCAVGAVGILLTRFTLVKHPNFVELLIVLAVAGLGFGIAVVPLTAAVLGHVPAAHSGMAASATNTARQIGSVVGVAALGALVNAHLTSGFGGDLESRGVPKELRDIVINLLQTGGSGAAGIDIAHPDPSIAPLVDSALAAFRTGLHVALYVSAGLMAVAALVTLRVPRGALNPDTEFD
jgi:hypothetical protein